MISGGYLGFVRFFHIGSRAIAVSGWAGGMSKGWGACPYSTCGCCCWLLGDLSLALSAGTPTCGPMWPRLPYSVWWQGSKGQYPRRDPV